MKIVCGGQTGVDRAVLDVALKHGIPCDGWCPAGRLDESGRIPDRYPVRELPTGGSEERTRQNVIDSDATVIIFDSELRGGSEYTLRCCNEHVRPCLLIDASKSSADDAGTLMADFVRQHNVQVLNVAGPRQTEWPSGYNYSFSAIENFLCSRQT